MAPAQDYLAFQSPSGNIFCALFDGEGGGARCDIMELSANFTDRPADCELDWGSSFFIGPKDPVGLLGCVGDTVADPSAPVLSYGDEISAFGITCRSETTGVTCENRAAHGFALSKRLQRLY